MTEEEVAASEGGHSPSGWSLQKGQEGRLHKKTTRGWSLQKDQKMWFLQKDHKGEEVQDSPKRACPNFNLI